MAKITIFGMAGTGTSTTGKALALKLRYDFLSSGNICREDARERGISIYERGILAKTDPSLDKLVDQRIAEFGTEHSDCVVESWLAWHFIPDSIKVKLTCDLDTRIERVSHRDKMPFEEAKKITLEREKDNGERYLKYYDIKDFSADEHFDLILDTTSTPVVEIVAAIERLVNSKLIHKPLQ
jgi:cytidylate kinase